MAADLSRDPFAEAAQYYHHRPLYAQAAIRWICDELALDGRGRMLDVGCGTGHVCRQFSGKFEQIVGIDPSEAMLREATSLQLQGFRSVKMKAEDLPQGLGTFRLITFGASFHRTDRERVLAIVHEMLEPKGALAMFFPSVPWKGDLPWKRALREVIQKWTSETIGAPFERIQDVVARSRFGCCQVR